MKALRLVLGNRLLRYGQKRASTIGAGGEVPNTAAAVGERNTPFRTAETALHPFSPRIAGRTALHRMQ